jgi:hypothetical protein
MFIKISHTATVSIRLLSKNIKQKIMQTRFITGDKIHPRIADNSIKG